MAISPATYEQVALEDGDTTWEYVCGNLREKPSMTQEHNDAAFYLAHSLANLLDASMYRVRSNSGRLRTAQGNAYVPDVAVIPTEASKSQSGTKRLETYEAGLPFVAEVWSPSTGQYDIDTKIPDYLARGDAVVWRVHPYDRLVTAWERQSDGAYIDTTHRAGTIPIPSLSGVSLALDEIFD